MTNKENMMNFSDEHQLSMESVCVQLIKGVRISRVILYACFVEAGS